MNLTIEQRLNKVFPECSVDTAPHSGIVYLNIPKQVVNEPYLQDKIKLLRDVTHINNGLTISLGNCRLAYKIAPVERLCVPERDDLGHIVSPYKEIKKFHDDFLYHMCYAKGSKTKHQWWKGGYYEHILATISIAIDITELYYISLGNKGLTRESIIKVLYFHDIEKLHKYRPEGKDPFDTSWLDNKSSVYKLLSHCYDINFNEAEQNALKYVHGELGDYNRHERVMNELATICHMADIMSARVFHSEDYVIK